MANQIFVTYNPESSVEQNTALRLQTIANLYGIAVVLPSRLYGNGLINDETKTRINNSDLILAFSLNGMFPNVSQELGHAIVEEKSIIVVYDKNIGKNINFRNYSHLKEVYIDDNNSEQALHEISGFINTEFKQKSKSKKTNALDVLGAGVGIAIMGIALGLLALLSLGTKNK
jgi:hypothetical protein